MIPLTPQQANAVQFMLQQEIVRVRELLDNAHWAIVGMREIAEAMALPVEVPNVFNAARAAGDLTELRQVLMRLTREQSDAFTAVVEPLYEKAKALL